MSAGPVDKSTSIDVPFLDLKAQYASIKDEVRTAIDAVLEKCAFVLGPFVKEFEDNYAQFCGTKHCVAVDTGTSALHMALLGAGIGPGDEVITAANTFIATCEAISYCGAKPVLVDMDETTYTIDPKLIEAAITSKTKAIIPVHLYGRPADMDPILDIGKKHGIPVIEDAAQAHGATYKGRTAGSMGLAGCFSFYPGKNLGAYGEGGAVVTNDDALADRIRMLRDHGSRQKYHHDVVGYNYRMEGIQGAILNVKLRHLPEWSQRRQAHANRYRDLLADANLQLPPPDGEIQSVYHLFVVQVDDRSRFQEDLRDEGIGTLIHYPIPVHQQKAYADHDWPSFPVTERQAGRIVSLPMFPEMTEEQIVHVATVATRSVNL
ncbi:MAG: aminotransferase class I/II-fold pyridoxal phosphate-dependent enzyme [candidate division Zixibacteria bacterium]|nr:aminotransferase class I/II-fold pyridoxal phosphate-dependent enzyme [candidate division Zixibacteria bacterium]